MFVLSYILIRNNKFLDFFIFHLILNNLYTNNIMFKKLGKNMKSFIFTASTLQFIEEEKVKYIHQPFLFRSIQYMTFRNSWYKAYNGAHGKKNLLRDGLLRFSKRWVYKSNINFAVWTGNIILRCEALNTTRNIVRKIRFTLRWWDQFCCMGILFDS